ncbi:MAG: prefoldin subunit [Candidatus Diapherotrites archaeon]|nr:prefoldin subunit [Candidatus Diapherotrites archaeon]
MSDVSQSIAEFERGRAQLAGISAQKQQLSVQAESLGASIEEIRKTKEEKVYKFAGSIMLLAPTPEVLADLESRKESVDLRLKTVEKQENILVDKLNKLKTEIEKTQSPQAREKRKNEDESEGN